jgi:hypothetical protein
MCTVLLPPGVNPSAVNKYITSSQIKRTRTKADLFIYWEEIIIALPIPTGGAFYK